MQDSVYLTAPSVNTVINKFQSVSLVPRNEFVLELLDTNLHLHLSTKQKVSHNNYFLLTRLISINTQAVNICGLTTNKEQIICD